MGFEPMASSLQRRHSAAELRAHGVTWDGWVFWHTNQHATGRLALSGLVINDEVAPYKPQHADWSAG